MNILINASNLRVGGGIQVADSICRELYKYHQHQFVVVYPSALNDCAKYVGSFDNVVCIAYNMPRSIWTTITGKETYLDKLVIDKNIDSVITVFGPSRWKPKVAHLSGFARPHIVLPDSPFWGIIGWKEKLKHFFNNKLLRYSFNKSSDVYWTESSFISKRLQDLFPDKKVFTITNNYNQVFNNKDQWDYSVRVPIFNGISLLTISANYSHKNLPIIIPTIHYIQNNYPDLNYRFVLTIRENQFPSLTKEEHQHILFIGPVSIEQCPYLYEQCDVMFLPSLLECFSASYAEAMVMKKPILTTNLEFAKCLCGDSALYYDATSPKDLGDAIYKLSTDNNLKNKLIASGEIQLTQFGSYEKRAQRLIEIVESLTL